jgi:type II secretory pathway pseudopilin PulG
VIAIIAILAAILFSVFAKAREKARQSSCLSNIKQIGLGLMMYAQDYDERLCPGVAIYAWYDLLAPYMKSTQILKCPSHSGTTYSYSAVYNNIFSDTGAGPPGAALGAFTSPAETLLIGDGQGVSGAGTWYYYGLKNYICNGGPGRGLTPLGPRRPFWGSEACHSYVAAAACSRSAAAVEKFWHASMTDCWRAIPTAEGAALAVPGRPGG